MASLPMSSVTEDSYIDIDYYCTDCKEQNIVLVADFYCKICVKFFCRTCIKSHKQHRRLLKKQPPYGRDKLIKWPLSLKMEKFLMTCDIHKDERLSMYCRDHSQLSCNLCVDFSHRQCSRVMRISECGKELRIDTHKLSLNIQSILYQMKSLQNNQETSMKSLQNSYTEHIETVIEEMRQIINSRFVTSKKELSLEELSLNIDSVLTDFERGILEEIKSETIFIKDSITRSIHNCTRLKNDLTQFHDSIRKIGNNKALCLIASMKCEHTIQQALKVLGKSGKVFTFRGKSEHIVNTQSDSVTCCITGCCVLPNGQVLVSDSSNKKVKLLNQQYQMVSHLDVSFTTWDVCPITPNEVAVTVLDLGNTHMVQFIKVGTSQLVPGKAFQLQHACRGIAHHHGDLFITSGTALYKYSLSGKLACILYEDAAGEWTAGRCAVSPTGNTLYITQPYQDRLLTLARDGTVLATCEAPELEHPRGVHVTPEGQVLLCGWGSNNILQVDWEGKEEAGHSDYMG
ncbi:nuclear factor 7, brain-like [Dreissena polymorpha]|uniref:B box-type domain-containing protein n=1 Tax=Dreissena polymorpha TaxID=45954 RepID=A0A9D4FZX7_DREPO|nr:nuclear factor 7, brain-like [Dreissena polymorpha]KAH3807567.1 hypothetical protein DPMN_135912 [Dreissena polymorpha]